MLVLKKLLNSKNKKNKWQSLVRANRVVLRTRATCWCGGHGFWNASLTGVFTASSFAVPRFLLDDVAPAGVPLSSTILVVAQRQQARNWQKLVPLKIGLRRGSQEIRLPRVGVGMPLRRRHSLLLLFLGRNLRDGRVTSSDGVTGRLV